MKITQNSALTAISTCAFGIFSVLAWVLFMPPESSKPVTLSANLSPVINPTSRKTPTPNFEEIEIKFEGIKETPIQLSENNKIIDKTAKFKITNRLKEWIYYTGYSNEDNCGYALYKDGNKLYQQSCWCGTGLAERTLWSKDFQVFEVDIPDNMKGEFQAQFNFKIGNKKRQKTIAVDFDISGKQ